MFHFEEAGIVDQHTLTGHPCVVGHSTVYHNYFLRVICHAVVRFMFEKAGIRVNNFDQKLQREGAVEVTSPGEFRLSYTISDKKDPAYLTVALTADDSVGLVAERMLTLIEGAWDSTTDDMYSFNLHEVELVRGNDELRDMRIRGTDLYFCLYATSILKIQNRTPSSTAASTDKYNVLNIESNPLVGKSYEGAGNGVSQRYTKDINTTSDAFTGRGADGLIDVDLSTFLTTDRNRFLHPPAGQIFEQSPKTANVRVVPGEIKKSVLTFKKKLKLNTMFKQGLVYMKDRSTTAGAERCGLGNYRFMMLEKVLDTDDVNEPEIAVGYELNNHIGGYCRLAAGWCDTVQERL
jgi:hypothetical protein